MKAAAVLRLLTSAELGYQVQRQAGSHRKLVAPLHPEREPIGFAFHDRATVPGWWLRRTLRQRAKLSDEQIRRLLG